MSPLVSIIIPCYNAERWVGEAIQSALAQTWPNKEVIVIDDGSTDRSLEVIKSFGSKIRWEAGPHRGANHARNRGLALAHGEWIQFLDADDFLLPEKIERQLEVTASSDAEVVYGDWRHQYHRVDGHVELGEIAISGKPPDLVEALLDSWWVASLAFLHRRSLLERIGGWDPSLNGGQDRDLFIRIALAGARVVYQPGCYSIYRRHFYPTITTGDRRTFLDAHRIVLDKALAALSGRGPIHSRYLKAAAGSYFALARNYYDIDRREYELLMKKVLLLCPDFRPNESKLYNAVQLILGFRAAERLAGIKRRVMRRLSCGTL